MNEEKVAKFLQTAQVVSMNKLIFQLEIMVFSKRFKDSFFEKTEILPKHIHILETSILPNFQVKIFLYLNISKQIFLKMNKKSIGNTMTSTINFSKPTLLLFGRPDCFSIDGLSFDLFTRLKRFSGSALLSQQFCVVCPARK